MSVVEALNRVGPLRVPNVELLSTQLPGRTTEDIARRAGFGTQMTLYRIFTSLRGMTPEEYRARLTK